MLVAAIKGGVDPVAATSGGRTLDTLPFDQRAKLRAAVYESNGARRLYVLGAFEEVLARCTTALTGTGSRTLTAVERTALTARGEALAVAGRRVLAVAERNRFADGTITAQDAHHLTLLAVLGIEDPPRPEVAAAVARARKAGVRIIMKTGDHAATAVAIARAVGILDPGLLCISLHLQQL
jgi:magnesium-transporting ATPase (P-type)